MPRIFTFLAKAIYYVSATLQAPPIKEVDHA